MAGSSLGAGGPAPGDDSWIQSPFRWDQTRFALTPPEREESGVVTQAYGPLLEEKLPLGAERRQRSAS